jgi:hypothetical protein
VSGDPTVVRVYRRLVGLYPRQFRDDYGADMVQLLRDQCADEAAWRVLCRVIIDLAITLPTQHLEAHVHRPLNPRAVPLIYIAVAAAAALAAFVTGTNVAVFIAGMCVSVVAGAMGAVAWRRNKPVGAPMSTGAWWKFVLAGPCIIAAVIIAAGVGVDAWFIGVISVLAAFVLTAIGLLLGVLRIANRRSRAGTLPT